MKRAVIAALALCSLPAVAFDVAAAPDHVKVHYTTYKLGCTVHYAKDYGSRFAYKSILVANTANRPMPKGTIITVRIVVTVRIVGGSYPYIVTRVGAAEFSDPGIGRDGYANTVLALKEPKASTCTATATLRRTPITAP